jgi:D-alanyl-D-alanine carboxypeptidase
MYIRTRERSALGPLQYSLGDATACTPDAITNGKLCSFNSKNGGSTTAVYVPGPARDTDPLSLLVWIHGDLICGDEGKNAVSYVKSKTFPLAKQVAESKRTFVLVAPTMHWKKGQNSHILGLPEKMNGFLEEVRAGLTAAGWSSAPSFGRLILAGHSRAYAVLNSLAARVRDAQSSQGALATLTDVWLFDTTYGKLHKQAHSAHWLRWAKAKSSVNLRILYRKHSLTADVAELIRDEAAKAGLTNVEVKGFEPNLLTHCDMPRVRMPDLLATAGNRPARSNSSRTLRPMPSAAPSAPPPTPHSSNGSLFQRVQNALASGQWYLAMSLAVMAGDRDADRLTNMIFFARHPALKGRKLAPTEPLFKPLSREWLDIRNRLVRPFLEKRTASQPVTPKGGVRADSVPASPAASTSTPSDVVRAWLAAPNPSLRAPYESAVQAWIRSTDRSAIELLPDPSQRRLFLEQVAWHHEYFPGNEPKSGPGNSGRAEALFRAIAQVVPERRVPNTIPYHDVTKGVVEVPNNPGRKAYLYPEARDAFVRMRDAAAAVGIRLVIGSSWRSAQQQRSIATRQPNPKAAAAKFSAHMYGLAVDLRLSVPSLLVSEADTRACNKKTMVCQHMANIVRMYRSPVYKWMALHGREFGWFPYRREPWHWEYNPPGFAKRFESEAGVL